MDLKPQFNTIRAAIEDHPDKGGIAVALAALDIAEETLPKLERIAVATEALAGTIVEWDGRGSLRVTR